MRQTIRQVTAVVMQVEDEVGVLNRALCELRSAGVSMVAVASLRRHGTALLAVPEDIEAVRKLASRHGVSLQMRPVFLIEGEDRVGALCEITAQIAQAGISIEDVAALSAGGNYAALLTFADADLEAASEALGLDTEDE